MVAKEEKRAARRIEQGTGLVDLRHFHLRYRWSICPDADQLAVWGGQDATPVSCFSVWIGELEVHCTVRVSCMCVFRAMQYGRSLEESWQTKEGKKRL